MSKSGDNRPTSPGEEAPQLTRLKAHVLAHPGAWIIFGLLVLVEYANYKHSHALTRVCDLTGPHDVWTEHPRTDREELDTICADHGTHDDDWDAGLEP
jgi:hypothetical protein